MVDYPLVRVVGEDGEVQLETGGSATSGVVVVRPGGRYVVQPANPQTKKHRGRVCEYIGVYLGRCGCCSALLSPSAGWHFLVDCQRCGYENKTYGVQGSARFLDTGRRGVVELSDLREVEEAEKF